MKGRINLLTNGIFMMFLGLRIEAFNRLLMGMYGKKRLIPIAWRLDRRLVKLRMNFSVLEKRHLTLLENIISGRTK